MADRPSSGELFGIPYNFDRPSFRRMLGAYWQPDRGMLVEKPFGIGYTLNLASWRSWVVLAVAAAMFWHEQQGDGGRAASETPDRRDPVEVVVDDD